MSGVLSEPAVLRREDEGRTGNVLMAGGTAFLAGLALVVCGFLEFLDWQVAIEGAAGIATLVILFYLLVRTRLNLRFRDPSLATEQTAAGILFLAYIMYHAGDVRQALTLFYPLLMLFAALRLSAARLGMLSLLALGAHGVMLHMSYRREQEFMDVEAAVNEFAVLMVTLPWFAAMSSYVNRLRLRLSQSHGQLAEAYARIQDIAVHDELTGVYNRRFLAQTLVREQARAGRAGGGFSLCLLDIDHFKKVNDSHGHAAGDEVLKQVAGIAGRGLRAVDVFGRFGGEEFLLILPDTDLTAAHVVAERIRAAIAAQTRVTVTVGVAQHAKGEGAEVLARADQALYRGKASGRNCVIG